MNDTETTDIVPAPRLMASRQYVQRLPPALRGAFLRYVNTARGPDQRPVTEWDRLRDQFMHAPLPGALR